VKGIRVMNQACLFVLVAMIGSQKPMLPREPEPAGTTRVAVVNMGYVFKNWERAKNFKERLDRDALPFVAKANELKHSIAAWEEQIAAGNLDAATKEHYEAKIRTAKRQAEDLADDMRRLVRPRSEENVGEILKEAELAIAEYSKRNGIVLVFGYADPSELLSVNPKRQAIDTGGATPLFMANGCDISVAVTDLLNEWYRARKAAIERSNGQ
jgi:Skp family chaperone for outer membrane proteins